MTNLFNCQSVNLLVKHPGFLFTDLPVLSRPLMQQISSPFPLIIIIEDVCEASVCSKHEPSFKLLHRALVAPFTIDSIA